MKYPLFRIKSFEANIQPKGDFSEEFYTKRQEFSKSRSFKEYNELSAKFGKEVCEELMQFEKEDVPSATVILTVQGIITKREIDIPLIHIRWLGHSIFIFDKIEG